MKPQMTTEGALVATVFLGSGVRRHAQQVGVYLGPPGAGADRADWMRHLVQMGSYCATMKLVKDSDFIERRRRSKKAPSPEECPGQVPGGVRAGRAAPRIKLKGRRLLPHNLTMA